MWWVVGALLEVLRDGGVETSVSIKRLLGHVDRELRRLQEQGETRYAATPPVDLINNLLYYLAQATSTGPRLAAVRQSFRLHEVMNADSISDVDAAEALSAPSVRLMKTVAAAIREDLTRVKDVLDIFVRKGATQVEDLAPQLEMLRKISDTLGVLGLGALRTRVEVELESLEGHRRAAHRAGRRRAAECGGGVDRGRRQPRFAAVAADPARQGRATAPASRPTKNSGSCRTPCCANASSTWRASRRRSRNRCPRRPKRRVSTRCRSSCAASRPAC